MADSSSVADKVLLVEGQDDKHVVRHLCIKNGLDAEICIRDKESIHRLEVDSEAVRMMRSVSVSAIRCALG